MRRRLVALALGAALAVLIPGCAPAFPTGTGPVFAGRLLTDSSQVCDALSEVLSDAAMKFGGDLGALFDREVAGDPSGVDRSRLAARARLTDLAFELWLTGHAAPDPDLAAAVVQASDNLNRLAFDQALLLGVRSINDLAAIARQVTAAISPLTALCQ